VAGTLLADRLLDLRLSLPELVAHAASLEGHADNVAPALLGGAQVAVMAGKGVITCAIVIEEPIAAVVFIPDREVSTSQARRVLPETVPLKDAVFNVGRSALTVAALQTGRYDLLSEAMDDKLHQRPRANLMPWLPLLIARAKLAGAYGAALSGAGSSICAFCAPPKAGVVSAAFEKVAKEVELVGKAYTLEVGVEGARIERES
jgi:homoserine kinase